MGVQSEADKIIASARDHIEAAIKDLSAIFVDECLGYDRFSTEYRDSLEKVFNKLIKIKKRL